MASTQPSGMIGRWDPWYRHAKDPQPYADTITYQMAAEWLRGLRIEDWGCGLGWFRRYHEGPYVGVDGTQSPFCDVVDDLVHRRTQVEGIMLRHVLEHNVDWQQVLDNAVASATKRLVIVTFIPSGHGEQVGWTDELGVPDIAIPHSAIDDALSEQNGWKHYVRSTLNTFAIYGEETMWLAKRM